MSSINSIGNARLIVREVSKVIVGKDETMIKILLAVIFGVIGLVGMNVILSLIVNPTLEKQVGTAFFGRVLFFNALAMFLASSLGAGINYARMKVFAEEKKTVNGEYNVGLLIVSAVAAAVTHLLTGRLRQQFIMT